MSPRRSGPSTGGHQSHVLTLTFPPLELFFNRCCGDDETHLWSTQISKGFCKLFKECTSRNASNQIIQNSGARLAYETIFIIMILCVVTGIALTDAVLQTFAWEISQLIRRRRLAEIVDKVGIIRPSVERDIDMKPFMNQDACDTFLQSKEFSFPKSIQEFKRRIDVGDPDETYPKFVDMCVSFRKEEAQGVPRGIRQGSFVSNAMFQSDTSTQLTSPLGKHRRNSRSRSRSSESGRSRSRSGSPKKRRTRSRSGSSSKS